MGGKVEKFRRLVGGADRIRLRRRDPDAERLAPGPGGEKAGRRQVIGTTAFCENAALLYDDRMFTVQPHPEFRKEFMEGLIKYPGPRSGARPDPCRGDRPDRPPARQPVMADRIADFFLTHQAKTLGPRSSAPDPHRPPGHPEPQCDPCPNGPTSCPRQRATTSATAAWTKWNASSATLPAWPAARRCLPRNSPSRPTTSCRTRSFCRRSPANGPTTRSMPSPNPT
jgi:hypothetical protein